MENKVKRKFYEQLYATTETSNNLFNWLKVRLTYSTDMSIETSRSLERTER